MLTGGDGRQQQVARAQEKLLGASHPTPSWDQALSRHDPGFLAPARAIRSLAAMEHLWAAQWDHQAQRLLGFLAPVLREASCVVARSQCRDELDIADAFPAPDVYPLVQNGLRTSRRSSAQNDSVRTSAQSRHRCISHRKLARSGLRPLQLTLLWTTLLLVPTHAE